MATNNLLNQSKPNYRSFVDNQVLTDDQLNDVLNHFNYQDQLSRVLLSGVGIVCGLKLSRPKVGMIELSAGAGITTAGDLLNVDTIQFSGFKAFNDANVKYGPFDAGDGSLKLWELETDTDPSDVHLLSDFSDRAGFSLEDAVAVLYLEDYKEDDEDCSPVDCNTQGREEIRTVRVLLVEKEDAVRLAAGDSVLSKFLHHGKESPQLPNWKPMYLPRVVLNVNNTRSYRDFRGNYTQAFDEIQKKIQSFASLGIFEKLYDQGEIDFSRLLADSGYNPLFVQYVYDFYRDLVTACNELQRKLSENYHICCPDPNAFPKHLLLGSLKESSRQWRHRFYPSPAHHHPGMVSDLKVAFERIIQMIQNFNLELKEKVEITPSLDDTNMLGSRAVPYYYDLSATENAADFIRSWREESQELVLNYYSQGYPNKFDPLRYELKGHDFYRIEGHLGWDITDAQDRIQELRKENGLCFDILPIAVGRKAEEQTIDYSKYRMYFDDLQVILDAWNKEHDCMIQTSVDFLSKFSTEEEGTHKDYPEAQSDSEAEVSESTSESSKPEKGTPKNPKEKELSKADSFTKNRTKYKELENRHSATKWMAKEAESADKESKAYNTLFAKKSESDTKYIAKKEVNEGAYILPHKMKAEAGMYTHNYQDETIYSIANYVESNMGYMGAKLFEGGNLKYYNPEILSDILINFGDVLTDLRKVSVLAPGTLIQLLADVEQSRLQSIDQFNADRLAAYTTAIEALCRKAKSTKKLLNAASSDSENEVHGKPWVTAYNYTLDRILSYCCITKKIEALYTSVLDRKEELLGRFILHRFINRHPGAEHKAGVAKGGTFILLYLSGEQASQNSFAGEASHFQGYKGIKGLRGGTVIGDLCLPYICCSDTPSATFVFPETPVDLRIPVTHVCMSDDGEVDKIPLTVRPAGASVKAYREQRELSNVITEQNGELFFDPNGVPESDYGKSIRFTVDDQPVQPMLTLYAKPEPRFTIGEDISFRSDNTVAVVTFENTSELFDELEFEWSFDGKVVPKKDAIKFTHQFDVKPGQNYDLEVILTATNGLCEATFSDTVNIDVPESDLPDNPDPDQPMDDECLDQTKVAVQNAKDRIGNLFTQNADQLQRFEPLYKQKTEPIYEQVLSKFEGVMKGDLDDSLFKEMVSVQGTIMQDKLFQQDEIDSKQEQLEMQFALVLFYELVLLYFYVQNCRQTAIGGEPLSINDFSMWPTFTIRTTSDYPQLFAAFLQKNQVHVKLTDINSRLGKRFTDSIEQIVSELLRMMKKVLNEQ